MWALRVMVTPVVFYGRRRPRILPEYAQFGMTISGIEQSDCYAVATSSAQGEILVGWDAGCGVEIDVCVVVTNIGGGCGTG